MRPVPHTARRAPFSDDWHLQNLRDNPELLAKLRDMVSGERTDSRAFAKQQLEEYDAWLKAKGFLPPEEDGRYGN